jgi:hypothetical protein
MNNNVIIGYSPHDFFYSKITTIDTTTPFNPSTSCTSNLPTDIDCNDSNFFSTNKANCITTAACKNKTKSDQLLQLNNEYSGSDEKYRNTKSKYDVEYYTMLNLGTGILGVFVYIYFLVKQ